MKPTHWTGAESTLHFPVLRNESDKRFTDFTNTTCRREELKYRSRNQ